MFDVASRSEPGSPCNGPSASCAWFSSDGRGDGAGRLAPGRLPEAAISAPCEQQEWSRRSMLNTVGRDRRRRSAERFVQAAGRHPARITAQAAERFYRAMPGSDPARVRNRLTVAAGAALEWLPQETILFDRCAVDRRLDVDLADDAGSSASNRWCSAARRWASASRTRGCVTGFACDAVDAAAARRGSAGWRDRCRIATRTDRRRCSRHGDAGPCRAERRNSARRRAGHVIRTMGEAGASAWDGMLVARILAADAADCGAR